MTQKTLSWGLVCDHQSPELHHPELWGSEFPTHHVIDGAQGPTLDTFLGTVEAVFVCVHPQQATGIILRIVGSGRSVASAFHPDCTAEEAGALAETARKNGTAIVTSTLARHLPLLAAWGHAAEGVGSSAVFRAHRVSSLLGDAPGEGRELPEQYVSGELVRDLDVACWIAGDLSQLHITTHDLLGRPCSRSESNSSRRVVHVIAKHASGTIAMVTGETAALSEPAGIRYSLAGTEGTLRAHDGSSGGLSEYPVGRDERDGEELVRAAIAAVASHPDTNDIEYGWNLRQLIRSAWRVRPERPSSKTENRPKGSS